ncbi:MAG: T9SS type A sorting domain-containing protein [Melioribacteraceae bacterium]|nr:T9SS type A sorting domain-containing protein [Melioribacteraceae bacterium]MCF8356595.1 T9SS type A sorting domain-containing protein [Melioribacteraceae bacterium]MCF8395185.1 T9SS type A sorting domain-containing protein [Melioribacteraceae bacterium]MCF8420029.1 T9SS type A sorting domain-containing protein [Melioribacteraceae bacterium]
MMGWTDSDTMKYFQLTDDDEDLVYTGTLTVNGPAWNGFEYRYAFKDISEDAFTQEPAGFGAFNYRVRYIAQDGAGSFQQPYDAPEDIWTNAEDKEDQWEEGPGPVGVNELDAIAHKFDLSQNYPNPFNPSTLISFSIPEAGLVTLKIYNILGQEVATLVNRDMTTGSYEVEFNASKLASGLYLYKLDAGNYTATKKMMLLK